MSKLIIVLVASLVSVGAFAQTCESRATEKKLAGAAKTSFMKKCEREAGEAKPAAAQVCESKAAEKKLAGAAKNSFVKKCVKDASGG